MKNKEHLICAAIWVKDDSYKCITNPTNITEGFVACGLRHCFIIEQLSKFGVWNKVQDHVQGFITSDNRFVDREEARKMWIKAGGKAMHPVELFSEDMY